MAILPYYTSFIKSRTTRPVPESKSRGNGCLTAASFGGKKDLEGGLLSLMWSGQFTVHYGLRAITSEVSSHGQNFIVMYNTCSTEHILVNVQVSLELLCWFRYTRIWPMTKIMSGEKCWSQNDLSLRKTDAQYISFKGKPGKINLFLGFILLQLRTFNILMILDALFASKLCYKPVCFAAPNPAASR